MSKLRLAYGVVLITIIMIYSPGCDLINPSEEIPAYIHIDSIAVKTDNTGEEGTSSHNIEDAWVSVGSKFIGVFQLPATFPVLQEGQREVVIRAGILNNGIANTRGQYPFYSPIIKKTFLKKKKVDSMGVLTTEYADPTVFKWMENFEDTGNITLKNSRNTDVKYQLTAEEDEVFEGNFSMKAKFTQKNQFFEVSMPPRLAKDVPLTSPVYLELNFKTDTEVKMGYIAVAPTGNTIQRSKVVLNETGGKWKKLYINLQRDVQSYTADYKFRIFFGQIKRSSGEATFYLDNLKLVHE